MQATPNIVLLVMDSVRAANLSCYGYPRPTTPSLDRLADEGTLYEQAISVGCWTLPVHASLFTGLYPLNHGLTAAQTSLPDGYPTLAHRLRELGYRTACFSSNPYVSDVTGLTQGFDTVVDLWRSVYPHPTRSKGSTRLKAMDRRGGLARLSARLARTFLRPRALIRTWKRLQSSEDSGARATNDWMREWLAAYQDLAAPFFIFVNYMESHEPAGAAVVRGPDPHNRRFLEGRLWPWRVARLSKSKVDILRARGRRRARDLETIRSLYDGTLSYLDERIGDIVNHLQSLGLLDDTIIVVTSDHGDSLGEHAHLGHRLHLYEQLVHVPLIVRYPPRFRWGARVTRQVQLGDLYPTLLTLAGGGGADGTRFKSLLDSPDSTQHDYTVAENTTPKSHGEVVMRMIRESRYKYISKSNGENELFDLSEDRDEMVNIVASRPDVARDLADRLESWERSLEADGTEADETEYDEETLHRLRGLGYIG